MYLCTIMLNKSNIGALFDRIAGSYDSLNHILSLGIDKLWRRKAIKGMQPAGKLLDVAIGTADLTLEILRQGKADHVTGLDLSSEMMRIGAEKVAAKGLKDKVEFIQGSAFEMPFEDGTFDAVTCSYGVRNFSTLDRGLAEMLRVLRPGGELMIMELSYPSNRVIAFFYDIYFSHILPLVGGLFSHDRPAYKYLNASVKSFIWGEEMVSHLRSVGFKDVTHKPQTFGISTIYRARK